MQNRSRSTLFMLMALMVSAVSLSAFAEDRSLWRAARDIQDGARGTLVGTVTNVDANRNRISVTGDNDRMDSVDVTLDYSSTQYNGFGSGNETFRGSRGMAMIRTGDRVEVRGIGRGVAGMSADTVMLLGHSNGTTSTSSNGTNSSSSPASSRYEGIVRQVNAADGRIVIETDQREMLNVIGSSSTPVYFNGDTYKLANLEVGDRIRVDPAVPSGNGDIRARSIDVLSSVSDASGTGSTRTNDRTVGAISGKVTFVDSRYQTLRVDTGRGTDVTIDLRGTVDQSGRKVRINDFLVGDKVTVTGTWQGQNTFHATTIRWGTPVDTTTGRVPADNGSNPGDTASRADYVSVVIYGTVQETLANGPVVVVKDKDMDRTVRLMVSDDFVVRTKTGGYATADSLKKNDQIVVKAYRDNFGNYIAQTIRFR